jgi:hypothetical protein
LPERFNAERGRIGPRALQAEHVDQRVATEMLFDDRLRRDVRHEQINGAHVVEARDISVCDFFLGIPRHPLP